jgi:hypothetical protein
MPRRKLTLMFLREWWSQQVGKQESQLIQHQQHTPSGSLDQADAAAEMTRAVAMEVCQACRDVRERGSWHDAARLLTV